jgi:hypothetical protein
MPTYAGTNRVDARTATDWGFHPLKILSQTLYHALTIYGKLLRMALKLAKRYYPNGVALTKVHYYPTKSLTFVSQALPCEQ